MDSIALDGGHHPSPRFGTSDSDGAEEYTPPFMQDANPISIFSQITSQIGSLSAPMNTSYWSRGLNRHKQWAQSSHEQSNEESMPSTPSTASGWQSRSEELYGNSIHQLTAWDEDRNTRALRSSTDSVSNDSRVLLQSTNESSDVVQEGESEEPSIVDTSSLDSSSRISSPTSEIVESEQSEEEVRNDDDFNANRTSNSSASPSPSQDNSTDSDSPFYKDERPVFRFGWWQNAQEKFEESQRISGKCAPTLRCSDEDSISDKAHARILSSSELPDENTFMNTKIGGRNKALTLILDEMKETVTRYGSTAPEARELLEVLNLLAIPTSDSTAPSLSRINSTSEGTTSDGRMSTTLSPVLTSSSGTELSRQDTATSLSSYATKEMQSSDSSPSLTSNEKMGEVRDESVSHKSKKRKSRRKSNDKKGLEFILETLTSLLTERHKIHSSTDSTNTTAVTDSLQSDASPAKASLSHTSLKDYEREVQDLHQTIKELRDELMTSRSESNELKELTQAQAKHLDTTAFTLERLELDRRQLKETMEKIRSVDIRRGEFIAKLQQQVVQLGDEKEALKIMLQETEQHRCEMDAELIRLRTLAAQDDHVSTSLKTLTQEYTALKAKYQELKNLNMQYEKDVKDVLECCQQYRTEAKMNHTAKLEVLKRAAELEAAIAKTTVRTQRARLRERKRLTHTSVTLLEEIPPSRSGLSRSVQAGQSFTIYEGSAAKNGSLAEVEQLKEKIHVLQSEKQEARELLFLAREEKRLMKSEVVRMGAQLEERNTKIEQLEFLLKCEVELHRRENGGLATGHGNVSRSFTQKHMGPLNRSQIPQNPSAVESSEVISHIKKQNKDVNQAFEDYATQAKAMLRKDIGNRGEFKSQGALESQGALANIECAMRSPSTSNHTSDKEACAFDSRTGSVETSVGSLQTIDQGPSLENISTPEQPPCEGLKSCESLPWNTPLQAQSWYSPASVALRQFMPTHNPFRRTIDFNRSPQRVLYAGSRPFLPAVMTTLPPSFYSGATTPTFGSNAGSREISKD